MTEDRAFLEKKILEGMSEGILTLDMDGTILLVNPSAEQILGRTSEELTGHKFAACFFGDSRYDEFNQAVLDAVYSRGEQQESFVDYDDGERSRKLQIRSSALRNDGKTVGVITVLNDITEVTELRDEVKAMKTIADLNRRLEQRNEFLRKTFGRYLTDEIVEEILKSPEGLSLGGTRRQISIMFSDIRGFTALCERMTPQDLIRMLNHYFGVMTEEISACQGTVIELLGDGMLVAFGLPPATEEHAARAAAAAIRMQNRMNEVNDWNREQGYPALAMGIGIHTDEVIVGNIGSEQITKYGVIGSGVNIASRIESCTTEDQILISSEVCRCIKEPVEYKRETDLNAKGLAEDMHVMELIGIGGTYNCRLNKVKSPAKPLKKTLKVRVRKLKGKRIGEQETEVTLLGLSKDHILMKGGASWKVFDNLMIMEGGGIYGKLIEVRDGEALISVTGRSDGFDAWLREQEEAER